ncbi:MAG: hypothetical protein MK097_07565 [Dechloromonas sp.]|nr:hypothetical protein [Dechloromonas sp.]
MSPNRVRRTTLAAKFFEYIEFSSDEAHIGEIGGAPSEKGMARESGSRRGTQGGEIAHARRSGGNVPVGAFGLIAGNGKKGPGCPATIGNGLNLGQRIAERDQRCDTLRMAERTIIIRIRGSPVGKLVIASVFIAFSLVLVHMVTEVLSPPCFMLAIARRHDPGNLEWQDNQQENG